MNDNELINNDLDSILQIYSQSFSEKVFTDESLEEDDLMLVFGLTQLIKADNKQYWGRELGMCWQRLVTGLCSQTCDNFSPGIQEGRDELCDLVIGQDAIDTKYRIGSGDSGTLKKFRQYSNRLKQLGFRPVLLILRNDSLLHAIAACKSGGWTVLVGNEAYEYIFERTGFNLKSWLQARKNRYSIVKGENHPD